jgi:hypothetical protein
MAGRARNWMKEQKPCKRVVQRAAARCEFDASRFLHGAP